MKLINSMRENFKRRLRPLRAANLANCQSCTATHAVCPLFVLSVSLCRPETENSGFFSVCMKGFIAQHNRNQPSRTSGQGWLTDFKLNLYKCPGLTGTKSLMPLWILISEVAAKAAVNFNGNCKYCISRDPLSIANCSSGQQQHLSQPSQKRTSC